MTTESQEQIKWIEVSDELPPLDTTVIVHRKGMLHKSLAIGKLVELKAPTDEKIKFWQIHCQSYLGSISLHSYRPEEDVVIRWFSPPRLPNDE